MKRYEVIIGDGGCFDGYEEKEDGMFCLWKDVSTLTRQRDEIIHAYDK